MKKFFVCMLAALLVLPTVSCKKKDNDDTVSMDEIEEIYAQDPNTAAWTMLEGMSLDEKIMQLFVVTPEALAGEEAVTEASDTLKEAIRNNPVGGVYLDAKNVQGREQTEKLLSGMQESSRVPLFTCIAEEGGEASVLAKVEDMGVTQHPSMREIGDGGDTERAYDVGKTLGTELSAIGFNVDLAPVADVQVAEESPVHDRLFGSDAETVGAMAAEVMRGMREEKLAAAIGHFPGEGSLTQSTAENRTVCERTYEEMQEAELLPFRKVIEDGADIIVVSNMVNKPITKTDMECCFSTNVMTNILRNTMGFPNVIMTASLSDYAIAGYYSAGAAALTAFEAGADMLFLPTDLTSACAAIKSAVESGRVKEMRVNESVSRILKVKLERGII